MFDIGWTELLVIAVVMIIVVGPKDLPAMLRTMGRYAGKLRRTASEFRGQFEDAIRESELDEIRGEFESLRSIDPAASIRETVSKSLESVSEPIDEAGRGLAGGADAAKTKSPRKKTVRTKAKTPKKAMQARKTRAPAAARKSKAGAAKTRA
jgi:sec-independent protein translocase protein TatB